MSPPELGLTLPLHGVQLVEASAGTGKTYTLATLYARLVLEARLDVGTLLAVTYTVAATAELRERLRQRLQQALQCIEAQDAPPDAPSDPLLAAALVQEGRAALTARLRRAVAAMDVAPILTIHAFCQRALADHALEAGQPLAVRALLANEAALQLEVATEFWRRQSRETAGARSLEAFAGGPPQLARTLRQLLACDALQPAPEPSTDSGVDDELGSACERLAATYAAHGADAREQLRVAGHSGAIHRTRSKEESVDPVWSTIAAWHEARDDALLHKNLVWFGRSELQSKWSEKKGPLPQSPLFDAIDAWRQASDACRAQRQREKVALLHQLRAFGVQRLAQLKRERGLVGFDDLIAEVAAALEGPHGEAFAARLQAQYRVALVDEFQDTDLRQAGIFSRLFAQPAPDDVGAARALFLIGDPKQAIYRFRGGDVVAYLIASHRADQRHALGHNFRSRPRALRALHALYQGAGTDAFAHTEISFQPVLPGGRCVDADFLSEGAPAPGVTVATLEHLDALPIEAARGRAAQACAAAILALLQDGAAGRSRCRRKNGSEGAVQPGDIAVLVETHDDALLLRAALDALAIPATAAGRDSVLLTPQAEELRRVLQALRAPGDEGGVRAALATPLLGFDAAALLTLERDEAAQREWQERIEQWRQRLQQGGPLGLLESILALGAERLLRTRGGDRAVANYLQLGELLQALVPGASGAAALLDAFERRIELADRDNEEELLRLESDAERVAILTLHASKGLEFEFVFLPLLAMRGSARRNGNGFVRHHDGEQRVLHITGSDAAQDEALHALECDEERAERLRLLYVGLTRARLATWIAWGAARKFEDTPLAWLLHRAPGAARVVAPSPEQLARDLQRWQAGAPDAIEVRSAAFALPGSGWRGVDDRVVPPAAPVQRELPRDWWVYSYSMLAREEGIDPAAVVERGAEDEPVPNEMLATDPSRFVGARFGNALHEVLEHTDFSRWRDWQPLLPVPDPATLDAALRDAGFGSEADLLGGRALLAELVGATLNARLPEGLRLCELAPASRRDELEFHLSLAPVAIVDLLGVLHAHGVVSERRAFGARRRIEGLLTGRIDLLYEHGGRYYVLDYKSNRLADYAPDALAAAVRDSEYDLQYVLYTLAVHRWLRFRLGTQYDYERHLGGVRYLYSRGLALGGEHGIHAVRPPRALIDALDALFAGRAGRAA